MSIEITPALLADLDKELEESITSESIGLILDLAVKHGIVSPPVWVIKDSADTVISGCFSSKERAIEYRDSLYKPGLYSVEHWKGQIK